MRLPARVWGPMLRHAAVEAPREACGLVLCDEVNDELTHFLPLANIAAEPEAGFTLAPIDLALWVALETRAGCRIVLFHSHPAAPAHPSHADLRYGSEGQRVLVLSLRDVPEIRAFAFQKHRDPRYRTRLRAVELPLDVER